MWKISDAIVQARQILQDTGFAGTPFRHSEDKLLGYLNQAFAQAKRIRPDLFLPDLANAATPFYVPADLDPGPVPDFPIDDIYYTAVVEYIAGFTGLGDDEFAQDDRAAGLLARFELSLSGGIPNG